MLPVKEVSKYHSIYLQGAKLMSYDIDEKKMAAGAAIVEKLGLLKKANPSLSDDFRAHTVQALFGTIWTRDGLALEERSLVTLTALIALNREHELQLHFRGARNLGIPREKIEEVILHLAHYAGWPNAVTASSVLVVVLALALDREVRPRRALQSLLKQLLSFWRNRDAKNPASRRGDVDGDADDDAAAGSGLR